MNVFLLGHGDPLINALKSLLQDDAINIIGVEQDYKREGSDQQTFESSLRQNNIKLGILKHTEPDNIDIVLIINYNKIIKDISNNFLMLNLHLGLLPQYRGNNANAWAVLNGEKEVGYTIHTISDELDGGDIYYSFRYDIRGDASYFNAKKAINEDISSNLAYVLHSIMNGELKPETQKGKNFIYCTKLRPSDGILYNWNLPSEIIIRKQYVFSRPLGTGLNFTFKNNNYEIGKIATIPLFLNAEGIPGSVVNIVANGIWVKTGDNAIELSEISHNGEIIDASSHFKIGNRLMKMNLRNN